MMIELSVGEIDELLESLEYSKMHVRDAPDTPDDVRQQKLSRLDDVAHKLRDAKREQA